MVLLMNANGYLPVFAQNVVAGQIAAGMVQMHKYINTWMKLNEVKLSSNPPLEQQKHLENDESKD
jgi:hypothetical protein